MDPVDEASGAWPVVSTRRAGVRGWSLPAVIRNMQYYSTQLTVFEDGVVDCWEGLDLALFRAKLETGWIATTVPEGARFSVFNLGIATVERFEPRHSRADIAARVDEALRRWNPTRRDLVDLRGEPSELRGKVRYARLPSLDGAHFRLDDAGERVMAREVPVVLAADGALRLTRWFVYADGQSRLGPEGPLQPLDAAIEAVERGRVTTHVPDGAWVEVDGIGRARLTAGHWFVAPRERVVEQRDQLDRLRGGPGATAACIKAWGAFEQSGSDEHRERLRTAYFAVPEHLRIYCGDMDTKDHRIRRALGLSSG